MGTAETETGVKKLWRQKPAQRVFLVIVVVILFGTILKFSSDTIWICKIYKTPEGKEIHYDFMNVVLYGLWLIGPPLFFLIEYVFIFGKNEANRMDTIQIEDIKYCQDLGSKIWGGISVFLGILLLIKYGIKL